MEESRRRHAEYYAAVAEEMGPALMGPDELAWRPRFRAALDNLRAAFTWALDSPAPGDEELAVRIVAALADQAPHDQAAGIGAWAELAADAAERSTPGRRTAVLGAAASSAQYRGEYELQLSYGVRALRDGIPPDCPAPSPAIMFRHLMGGEQSMDALVDAADTLKAIGAPDYNLTHVLAAEALEAVRLGHRERALSPATRAIEWARRVANPTGLAVSLPVYALAFFDQDPRAALAAAQEAIALTRAGASDGVIGVALAVAAALIAPSDRAAALSYCRDLLDNFREVGVPLDLGFSVWAGVRVMATIGEAEIAAVLLGIWDSSGFALLWAVPVIDERPLADAAHRARQRCIRRRLRTRPRLVVRRIVRSSSPTPLRDCASPVARSRRFDGPLHEVVDLAVVLVAAGLFHRDRCRLPRGDVAGVEGALVRGEGVRGVVTVRDLDLDTGLCLEWRRLEREVLDRDRRRHGGGRRCRAGERARAERGEGDDAGEPHGRDETAMGAPRDEGWCRHFGITSVRSHLNGAFPRTATRHSPDLRRSSSPSRRTDPSSRGCRSVSSG